MRLTKVCGVLGILCCCALASLAQEAGPVARLGWFQAREGMERQLEAGIVQHMKWHKKVNDPWAWAVWQVVAGEKTGWYVGGVFGLHWADFDNPPVSAAEDSDDAAGTTRPFIGPVITEFLEELPEWSRPPEDPGPSRLLAVNVVRVKLGRRGEYLEAVLKTKRAMDQAGHPLRYMVDEVRFGGRYHTFYFVHPAERWADFEPRDPSIADALKQAYGAEETARILRLFSDTTAEEHTLMLVYRPDLSYVPAQE